MANQRVKILSVAMPALIVPFLGAWLYFSALGDHPMAKVVYGLTKVFTFFWPIIALRVILRESISIPIFKGWKASAPWVHGLGSGLGLALVGFALMQTPIGSMVRDSAGNIRQKTSDLGILDNFWLFASLISIFHSLLEEYFWRWFAFGQLRRLMRPWAAHILAGLAFSAHHIVVTLQYFPLAWGLFLGLSVGLGGILWSFQYEQQQSLLGPWLSHILVDFTLMAIGAHVIF